jgi:CO/xanthine dehydrogenase Mo-binding subunit
VAVDYVAVGKRTKRVDAPVRLTGAARFAADLRPAGLLHARPVGSPYAHATIKSIDRSAALAIPGVVAVLTTDDLPFADRAAAEAGKWPIAFGEALYVGQFVAIVLAETEAAAEDGVAAVEIEYEELDSVNTIDAGLQFSTPAVRKVGIGGDNAEASMHNADAASGGGEEEKLPINVTSSIHFHRGDVAAGFAEADATVELTFTSQTVHQGYIEPQVAMAAIDPLGDLTIYTATQALFYCRSKVAETLGYPAHRVKVEAMPVGGGFGGKFVLIEPLVALLAVAAQRPVLLQYTRMEDFVAGNPAPECKITLKAGAKQDGTLTALQGQAWFDSGSTSGSPLSIGCILMGGYYKTPNLDIRGYEVLTNRAAAGAYRAPGAQQGTYAIESVVDELARKLGMDPLEFRLKNCVEAGDPRANGAPWPRIGLKETLEALKQHPAWQNRESARAKGRGVGIAVGGWPGGVEPATAVCRLDSDGNVTVALGSVDLSGTNTTFAQIAAETFGASPESVQITTANTDSAPYAGGTGGSKITYTVGAAVQKAAEDAKQQIMEIAAQHLEAAVEDLELVNGAVQVRGVPGASVTLKQIASMSMTFNGKYDPVFGRGSTAITDIAPGFAAHLAEVEVDDLTGEVKVVNYVAAQDVGFAINPASVEGQIYGGVVQGLGWALYEGLYFDESGQPASASLMEYVLPRATMAPPIDVVLVEVPSEKGAYGAKGVGEPPAIPGPATIANAIRDAAGVRVTTIPMKPEVVAKALQSTEVGV